MAKIFATTNPDVSEREIRNENRSRKIASQGMVLLSNNGVLPLKNTKRVALYGNGARKTIGGGTGSGGVNSRKIVNVEQGLEAAGFEVCSKKWLDRYNSEIKAADSERSKKMEAAKKDGLEAYFLAGISVKEPLAPEINKEEIVTDCDTALYVIARNSGEGSDRKLEKGDYLLSDVEQKNLQLLTESYEKVVVILNVGGVVDTKFLRSLTGIDAILLMSQAGNIGGYALADVLTGKVTPSGHLTTTWAENYEDYPSAMEFSHMNGNIDDEYYKEGIFVGYRYFDTFNVTPAYPFGFGLSYTDFKVDTESVNYKNGKVTVNVTVTNIGNEYSGKEVLQVYYSAPQENLEKPYQELAAFSKTKELAPGESQKLSVSFPVTRMASYSEEKASYVLESGLYYIRVGVNSRATHIAAALKLGENIVTEVLSNRLTLDCEMEQLSNKNIVSYTYAGEDQEKKSVDVIEIPMSDINVSKAVYRTENKAIEKTSIDKKITIDDVRSGKYTLDEMVSQLTIDEMANLCVGTGRESAKGNAQFGMASTVCPGAAGDTSSLMSKDRNVRNMVLADGPAGLRLVKDFKTYANGEIILSTVGLKSIIMQFFPGIEDKEEIPDDAISYYQYCTAIPIATLLAQTWDVELIEQAGSIVGEEMNEFGVTLWLAPGMNIHRNPLCGRNFEYYSEDPYVAGVCAAADTIGVQKNAGIGTTIKHFAINNQEDNRDHVNVHISERATREIYLKGFEYAVKNSQPMSIMTSYNLINGVHSANNYDLVTAIAKDEWGFKGFVMTDWGTTGNIEEHYKSHKYTCSSADACIKAGNDLTMPGSQYDIDQIVNSVNANKDDAYCPITLGDLQACAKRILNILVQSSSYDNAVPYAATAQCLKNK